MAKITQTTATVSKKCLQGYQIGASSTFIEHDRAAECFVFMFDFFAYILATSDNDLLIAK